MDPFAVVGGMLFAFAMLFTMVDYWFDTKPMIEEMHGRMRLGNEWYDDRVMSRRYHSPKEPPIIDLVALPSTVTNVAKNSGPGSEDVIYMGKWGEFPSKELSTAQIVEVCDVEAPWADALPF